MYIFVLILIIALIFILKNKSTPPTPSQAKIQEYHNIEADVKNTNVIDYKTYYKPKIYIMTKNEGAFFNILFEIAKELDYMLFTQVSLYNIVKMQSNLDYSTQTRYFNKIAAKSIDFVLTDKEYRIKLCIELDDNTHGQEKRIERDEFVDKLFSDLGISLLRYPVYTTYYKDTLKKRILENIKDEISVI